MRRFALAVLTTLPLLVLPSAAAAHSGLITHADPIPRPPNATARLGTQAGSQAADFMADTWCGAEQTADLAALQGSAPVIKVVYAHASDQADQTDKWAPVIQRIAKRVSQAVAEASGDQRAIRYDLGSTCGSGYLDLQTVHLPKSAAQYVTSNNPDFWKVAADVRAAIGASAAPRNIIVFVDNLPFTSNIGGYAQVTSDSRPGQQNNNTRGGNLAAVFGRDAANFVTDAIDGSAQVTMHEMFHNLGAVQNDAPNATGALHCRDGHDIMCYADGGPQQTQIAPPPCAGNPWLRLDCNGDDYFNPSPTPGSWLSSHWNVYDSPFLCAPADCAPSPGPRARLTVTPGTAGQTTTLDASTSALPAAAVRYEWDLDVDGTFETQTTTATTTHTYSAPGTYTAAVKVTDATGASSTAAASFTVTAVPAHMTITGLSEGVWAAEPTKLTARIDAADRRTVSAWKWAGQGGTVLSNRRTMTHTFSAGHAELTVTAALSDGTSASVTAKFTVRKPRIRISAAGTERQQSRRAASRRGITARLSARPSVGNVTLVLRRAGRVLAVRRVALTAEPRTVRLRPSGARARALLARGGKVTVAAAGRTATRVGETSVTIRVH